LFWRCSFIAATAAVETGRPLLRKWHTPPKNGPERRPTANKSFSNRQPDDRIPHCDMGYRQLASRFGESKQSRTSPQDIAEAKVGLNDHWTPSF
jgi:hypothetical protein